VIIAGELAYGLGLMLGAVAGVAAPGAFFAQHRRAACEHRSDDLRIHINEDDPGALAPTASGRPNRCD